MEEGLAILDEDGRSSERSSKLSRNILTAMQCYNEMLKEMKMKTSQTALLSFFKKKKKEAIKLPESQPSTAVISKAKQLPVRVETSSRFASPPSWSTWSPDPDDPLSP
jgi:hypothetical protein